MNDEIPLSYVNQFAYCPRRFWYMYVYGEMMENAYVLQGIFNHERVHTPGYHQSEGRGTVLRRVYVYSRRLKIRGYCDLVEVRPDGTLYPVEYKQGRRGRWHNDRAQLCAQALCLEEMTGLSIPAGAIFYFGSRQREEVIFAPSLRAETETLIQDMHQCLAMGLLPSPTENRARCQGCSLYDLCLPWESDLLSAIDGDSPRG